MYVVGITGASGSILGVRLVEELLARGEKTAVLVTDTARQVIAHEVLRGARPFSSMRELLAGRGREFEPYLLIEESNRNFLSPLASGSNGFEAVILIPCSMKSLAGVASGYADSLLGRIADVALKERRRLVVVPRETPLGRIHLENMLRLKDAGADIVPPVPAFYTMPETIDDVINFIVGRVLSLLGFNHDLYKKWASDD